MPSYFISGNKYMLCIPDCCMSTQLEQSPRICCTTWSQLQLKMAGGFSFKTANESSFICLFKKKKIICLCFTLIRINAES